MTRAACSSLLLLLAAVTHAQTDPRFALCLHRFESSGPTAENTLCFRRVGRGSGALDAALAELGRLEAMRGRHPEIELARGGILSDLGMPGAVASLADAADGCRRAGSRRCEVLARLELASLESPWDQAGAAAELARAEAVAAALEDDDLTMRVRVASAWRHLRDDQPARAAVELDALEGETTPETSIDTLSGLLQGLGYASWSTGRSRASREYYRRLMEVAAEAGDSWLEVQALASFSLLDLQIENPAPETVRDRLAQAVVSARSASNPFAELKLRALLAQAVSGEDRTTEWKRVKTAAKRVGAVEDELLALRFLGRLAMEAGRASEAVAALDEAEEVARVHGMRDAEIRGCSVGIELRRAAGRHAEARVKAEACLGLIDRLRDRQVLPLDRARVFTQFSHVPRMVADDLLEFDSDIQGALDVLGRYRASSLEEALAQPVAEAPEDYRGLRDELTRVQLELAYGRPSAARLRELEADLRRLEAEELEVARSIASVPARDEPVPIAELQTLLEDGEVLVVFSMAGIPTELWSTTGCWAIAITDRSQRAVRLPPVVELVPAVEALAGLLGRTDSVTGLASARVYELLLGDLAPELASARRLIVLLDDPLQELPLAALREEPDAPPLVARLEIELIPSIGMWRRWRKAGDPTLVDGSTVIVASPSLDDDSDSVLRDAQLPTVAALGRLPGAMEEASLIADRMGGSVRLMVGAAASEAALRKALVKPPGVLHIAAHAFVDARRPNRSAIVLAPGEGQDGLLQPRDIVELDLEGSLVVLAACRSLGGELVNGDAIVGLGHAFLEAGARAVVGATRPLDDRGTSELMTALYANLEAGDSAARALARAQALLAEEGRPASEWATVLLVGDGALRLAPHRQGRPSHLSLTPMALALGIAIAALGVVIARRQLARGR